MRLFGLIGWPLGHSFSKKYFSEKFEREGIQDARYELFPLEKLSDLGRLLRENPELRGLNVTIPYKEKILPFLHELDETAKAVGAVNCIKITDNQQLIGFNTDAIGFEKSLPGETIKACLEDGRPVLILGTGGASKAVAYVFKKLGIPFLFVSRTPASAQEISYEALSAHSCVLLVNTTPVGTHPKTGEKPPLPADFFKPDMFVYDLIYNPAETLLLHDAKSQGCRVNNGLEMLELQAEAAWEIWQQNP